jgi:drug/metabolite transporter (DMT)-like permease
MRADRPLLGIALMIGFCVTAPAGDAIAKLLGGTIPLLQLVTVRFAAQAILLLPVMWLTARPLTMTGRAIGLTVVRTLLHIAGLAAMFTALRFLPLADAIAMAFVMPFIMLLLGWMVLDEEVGRHRLIGCLVGFSGTLLVVQPSFAAVGPPALLPLLVAVIFALFMMVSRQLARENDPITLQAASGMVAVAVLAPAAWLASGSGIFALETVLPSPSESVLLAGIGVLGTLGHLLMTWALRFAPSATLAPIQYLEIPLATAAGWLVFGDLPNGVAAIGIVVTIIAGLYIVHAERTLPQAAASEA